MRQTHTYFQPTPNALLRTFTVPSKEAEQSSSGLSGLADPGPQGVHRTVYISFSWPVNSALSPSSSVHILAVKSSEHEARKVPPGLQLIAFTSSVWLENDWSDCEVSPNTRHIWIVLSTTKEGTTYFCGTRLDRSRDFVFLIWRWVATEEKWANYRTHPSEEQLAKTSESRQSTSSTGAECTIKTRTTFACTGSHTTTRLS